MFLFWFWTCFDFGTRFSFLLTQLFCKFKLNKRSIRAICDIYKTICEICIVIVFTANFEQISYSPRVSLILTLNRCLFIRLLKIVLGGMLILEITFVVSSIIILNISTTPSLANSTIINVYFAESMHIYLLTGFFL